MRRGFPGSILDAALLAGTPMIQTEIRILLDAPRTGEGAPTLARLEDSLTSGYAHAMALDAERSRLQRRLAKVAAELEAGGGTSALELKRLAGRLASIDDDLSELRSLLRALRERRAEVLRAAA
jgi:hypothetical protein